MKRTFNNLLNEITKRLKELDEMKWIIDYGMEFSDGDARKTASKLLQAERNNLIYILGRFNYGWSED